MDALEYETIVSFFDEYIGDDLTWEDLTQGLSAFLEDRDSDAKESVAEPR